MEARVDAYLVGTGGMNEWTGWPRTASHNRARKPCTRLIDRKMDGGGGKL